jgi:hypothetical protein
MKEKPITISIDNSAEKPKDESFEGLQKTEEARGRVEEEKELEEKEDFEKNFEDSSNKNEKDLTDETEKVESLEKEKKDILEKEEMEKLRKKMEEKREDFILSEEKYNELINDKFKGKFFRKKRTKKFKEKLETEKIKEAFKIIKSGDREKLNSDDEEEKKEVEDSKLEFITFLHLNGVENSIAEQLYERELDKVDYDKNKVDYGRERMKQRLENLKEEGIFQEDAEKMVKKELFEELIIKEKNIINERKKEKLSPENKRYYRKAIDWYLHQNVATRLLISTGIVTGAVTVSGGFGAPAAAMFAGYRFLRGAGAIMVGKAAGAGIEALSKKSMRKREAQGEEIKSSFDLDKLSQIEKRYKKHLDKLASEKRKIALTKIMATVAAGSSAALGLSLLEQTYLAPEIAGTDTEAVDGETKESEAEKMTINEESEIERINLTIGSRGPEGSIIDYFRENPGQVKNFGAPEGLVNEEGKIIDKAMFNKWAGGKAHLLWLEQANRALEDPEVLTKMDNLGYSKDLEGYGEMMRRIKEGSVILNPETGEAGLEDVDYLKAAKGSTIETEGITDEDSLSKNSEPVPLSGENTQGSFSEPVPLSGENTQGAFSEEVLETIPGQEMEYMSNLEKTIVKGTGFSPSEYKVMGKLTIEKLLKEVSPELIKEAEVIEKGGSSVGRVSDLLKDTDLPKSYSTEQYRMGQIKLARFLYSFDLDGATKKMEIGKFIRMHSDELDKIIKSQKV